MTTAKRSGAMCIDLRHYFAEQKQLSILFATDVHFDSVKCKRDLFFSHLKQAKDKNALISLPGDFFDIMGGFSDPRRNKSEIRSEYNSVNYLDLVIEDAAEQLSPFADNIMMFGNGNHETAILKKIETNPLARLVNLINIKNNTSIIHTGYHGFVRCRFEHSQNAGNVKTKLIYFHHGLEGGSVNMGFQAIRRRGSVLPDADVVVSGHSHDRWSGELPRMVLKANGEVQIGTQIHLRCGTYKEEFDVDNGFAVEKIALPKSSNGGWWVHFEPDSKDIHIRYEVA